MVRLSGKGIAAALLVVVVAAVCVRLGFWQLDRLEERRARNAELAAALAAPPIELVGEMMDSVLANPARYRYRRARAVGVYDSDGAFLLRGRARRGAPGVHLVAPFRLVGGDGAILVDRGWLPANDAATADPRPYESAGRTAVEGLIQPLEPPQADAQAVTIELEGTRIRTFQRLDPAVLRTASPGILLPFYLQRTPHAGGPESLPLPVPIPGLDEGPHLGYAMQWFSFAAIAVIGFGVVLLRGRTRA